MTDGIHQFKLGALTCYAIQDAQSDGTAPQFFTSDLSDEDLNANVKAYGYDPESMPLSFTCLYIDTGDQKILIDSGNGQHSDGKLVDHLASLGVQPTEIDIFLLSHGHGDHYMGLTDGEGNLTYPNAVHYVMDEEWDFWLSDEALAAFDESEPERAEQLRTYFLPIKPKVKFFSADNLDIHDNIHVFPAYGHTHRHVGFIIQSEGEKLLYAGDAAVHPLHFFELDWGFKFDKDADIARESRVAIREWSRDNDSPVLLYHHVFPGIGKLAEADGQWQWVDVM